MVRAVTCGVLLAAGPAVMHGQTTPPARATVDQLAWVAGAWTGTLNDRTIEQHWSAPRAGTIIAMYRSIRGAEPTLYELLAMENEGGGVVLRIKHFKPGPGLVGQEAQDESRNHTLVKIEERTAVFEGDDARNPVRITFSSPDRATLNITVERQRDGKPVSTQFNYTRIGS